MEGFADNGHNVDVYKVDRALPGKVYNRESKQLLNLGGCQSSNFNAQIAETTISMIAYLLLTLRFRYDNYESKGALYRSMNAKVLRETLDRRLWGVFIELVCAVSETLEIDADELLERMLTNPKAETMIAALCSGVLKKEITQLDSCI